MTESPLIEPPSTTERLFPEGDLSELLRTGGRDDVIARLLEEGETSDLRWMATAWSERELADWVERFGARRLSRRSRRFWEAVLAVDAGDVHPLVAELWPL